MQNEGQKHYLDSLIGDLLEEYPYQDLIKGLAAGIKTKLSTQYAGIDFSSREGIKAENELALLHAEMEQLRYVLKDAVPDYPPEVIPVGRWKLVVESRKETLRRTGEVVGHWGFVRSPDLLEDFPINKTELNRSMFGVCVNDLIAYAKDVIIPPKEAEWRDLQLTPARIKAFTAVLRMLADMPPKTLFGKVVDPAIQSSFLSDGQQRHVNFLVQMGVFEKNPLDGKAWSVRWSPDFCRAYARSEVADQLIELSATI